VSPPDKARDATTRARTRIIRLDTVKVWDKLVAEVGWALPSLRRAEEAGGLQSGHRTKSMTLDPKTS